MEGYIPCSALTPSPYQLLFLRFCPDCNLLFVIPVSMTVILILLLLLILQIMLLDCGITDQVIPLHIVPDLSSSNNNNTFDCHICPLAKQHKLPFPKSTSVSLACFDLIHVDIWGPYSAPSLNGSKYFLTLVDDHNRCTWVYLMKSKSDTSSLIQVFFQMILNQFKVSIKVIRSDNGPKFALSTFYASKGVLHQLSCVETPQ